MLRTKGESWYLWKGRIEFCQYETVIANFLYLTTLICKVFFNSFWKRQFVELLVEFLHFVSSQCNAKHSTKIPSSYNCRVNFQQLCLLYIIIFFILIFTFWHFNICSALLTEKILFFPINLTKKILLYYITILLYYSTISLYSKMFAFRGFLCTLISVF